MIASLLAVGATPVGAAPETADHKATTSACVGDALGDQMFTDVSDGHVFRDAINCIAYYGVTNGTGDGSTFSPNDDVTRAQMAVFLARAAGIAGVDLGDAMDAGFGDIDDTWAEARDAINRLASKGIVPSGANYRPNDAMTRAEMAIALIGLLNKASSGVKINDNGTITLSVNATPPNADDHFADARALSPIAVDRAAAALFELGVTNGTGTAAVVDPKKTPLDTNFDPNGTVSRGQMAAFITRALAHTSARPEGVTAQAVGNKVLVSVRDTNFAPVSNVWVEVFYVDSADEEAALNADGTCGRLVERSGSGTTRDGMHPCEIDGADLITGGSGNAETQALDVGDDGVVAWAWTGAIGDEVDDGTALYRLAMSKGPAAPSTSATAHISNDLAGTVGKMGSTVTLTLQLKDGQGNDVAGGHQAADKPAKWIVTIDTYSGATATGTSIGRSQVYLTSDSDGKATFVLASLPDPRPNMSGDMWTVGYSVVADPSGCTSNDANDAWIATNPCSAPTEDTGGTHPTVAPLAIVTDGDATTNAGGQDSSGSVTFTDASGKAAKIEIETSSYVVVAGRSGRTALNRATVKVTDQFGDPVPNAKVTLTSSRGQGDDANQDSSLRDSPASANAGAGTPDDATDDANNGREFTTGSDGTYTFGYTWSGDGAVETLTARTAAITATDGSAITDADDDATNVAAKTVNWAQEVAAGTDVDATAIVGGDVEANHVVFLDTNGVPMYMIYDNDDRYNTNAAGVAATADAEFADIAAFEKMLAAALAPGGPATTIAADDYSSRPRHTTEYTIDNTTG
ncbi:MAG: S-layer homology domain-containing protein [Acidimicrobiia bacterium]|nr:S-layer homology domain-containing protein [Acidimicrobiia bacterium]